MALLLVLAAIFVSIGYSSSEKVPGQPEEPVVGQMMALVYLIFGASFLLVRIRYPRFVVPVQYALQLILLVLIYMAGEWAYGIPVEHSILYSSSRSIFGVILMILATVACIAVLPSVGLSTLWHGSKPGNVISRTLMSVLVILAIVLGYVLSRVLDLQLLAPNMALLIFGFSILTCCFIVVTVVAYFLNQAYDDRQKIEEQLTKSNEDLEAQVAARTAELERTVQLLKETNEAASIGYWQIDLDSQKVHWSDGTRKVFGWGDVPLPSFEKALEFNAAAQNAEKMRVLVRDAIDHGNSWEEELLIETREGEKRWVLITCKALNKDAKCKELRGTVQNIDDRKRAEIELTEEQQFLQLVIDNIPVNIYVKDLESRKTLVNKAELELLGVSDPAMVIGKNDYDLYPKSSADISRAEDLRIINDRQVMRGQETCLHLNNGDVRWFLSSKIPLIIKDNVKGILGVSVDITQRKLDEEKLTNYAVLEAKSKEMEELTYVTSHDLREPLLTIKNYTQAMVEDFGEQMNDDAIRYSEAIDRGVGRMEELIGGLLDYSRLSRPKAMRPADMNELVSEVLSDLQAQTEAVGAKIIVEDLPQEVWGYTVEIKMLWQNLVANALKFRSPERVPEITIGYKNQNGVPLYFVKDNGIGIPKESYLQVFVIFRQLHERGKYEGIGIGLAHCKKIAELHNGKIWVESELGSGSCFYFTLNS
ncbi:sensor histidine kinase [Marinoscillum furvescens]|nr:PAS domain-containing sensor histidine kinase [Marinoscillum furvescens]